MWPTRRAARVWRRNLESWKRYALPFLVAALGEPLFYLLGLGYGLGQFVADIDGVPYAAFLAPGIVVFTAMNAATFETTYGAFTRMTEQNTYNAILATPCSVADVVAGDILWGASKAALSASFMVVAVMLLGLVRGPLTLLLVPLGFLVGLMFGALGMIVTARAPSYDFFNYYFTLVFSVMILFTGVFFPLAGLPVWARWFAWLMPLTHAVTLSRAVATGTPTADLTGEIVWILVVTALAFVVAERLVRRRLLV